MMSSMKLSKGDKIAIVSSARAIGFDELIYADKVLKDWGLIPVYGNTIGAKLNQFAGDDGLRTDDLQQMLDDDEIKAILFARGGYGTIRIIEKLDFTGFVNHPKLICGYSDITVMHTHINDKLGIETVHSSMPFNFEKNSIEALLSLKNILFGKLPYYKLIPYKLNKIGEADAELIGGNLSILYSLLGTNYGFSTAGKILFIEDIDEYYYHIDRMMMSLKLAGKLQHIKGLVAGGFSDIKDNQIPFGRTAEEIIYEYMKDLNIPVCFNFPAGHIKDNRALLFGKKINLKVEADGVTIRY